jgi:hypothetical protein
VQGSSSPSGVEAPATSAAIQESIALIRSRNDPVLLNKLKQLLQLPQEQAAPQIQKLGELARRLPELPATVQQGAFFDRGGTSELYEVAGRPDLLLKRGGGRLPREAQALVELELRGIPTVYAGTQPDGSLLLRRIDGVGSKNVIGRLSQPLSVPQNTQYVTQKTIDDLERIRSILEQNGANVGDFQFIIRKSDGAVLVNDPVSFHEGSGPSAKIDTIIARFKKILRLKQTQQPGTSE